MPSLVPYLQRARISLVPLLHGAGTKRKVLQALAAGTPTVTTSVGAEGLEIRDGKHALIADDPAAFAAAVERLLHDPELWARLRNPRALAISYASGLMAFAVLGIMIWKPGV